MFCTLPPKRLAFLLCLTSTSKPISPTWPPPKSLFYFSSEHWPKNISAKFLWSFLKYCWECRGRGGVLRLRKIQNIPLSFWRGWANSRPCEKLTKSLFKSWRKKSETGWKQFFGGPTPSQKKFLFAICQPAHGKYASEDDFCWELVIWEHFRLFLESESEQKFLTPPQTDKDPSLRTNTKTDSMNLNGP